MNSEQMETLVLKLTAVKKRVKELEETVAQQQRTIERLKRMAVNFPMTTSPDEPEEWENE